MRKLLLFIIPALFFGQSSSAQKVALKQPADKAFYASLDSLLNTLQTYNANAQFTFGTYDFYSKYPVKADTLTSLDQVKEMEKQLRNNYHDATVYTNIGMVYKNWVINDEAEKHFGKALKLAAEYVQKEPDSAEAHHTLATASMCTGNFKQAIESYKKYFEISKDSTVLPSINSCYLFNGDYAIAIKEIERLIDEEPTVLYNYIWLLQFMYWQELAGIRQARSTQELQAHLKGKKPEEIFDFTKFKRAYLSNRNDTGLAVIYHYARHSAICIKTFMLVDKATAWPGDEFNFVLEKEDRKELDSLQAFYEKCILDTGSNYSIILNKALGNIHLLKNERKKALPYFEKVVQLKPLSRSTFIDNAEPDYDNVSAAYLLQKDTAMYEKKMKLKFDVRPAISPVPSDYLEMAQIYLSHGAYDKAKQLCKEALKMNPNFSDAYVVLIKTNILQRDFKLANENLDRIYKVDPNNCLQYVLSGICLLHGNQASIAYTTFVAAKDISPDDASWIEKDIINRYFDVRK